MAVHKDWLPGTMEGPLLLAKDWKAVMTAREDAWGIPPAVLTELDTPIAAAAPALTTGKNETTRTPVTTAQYKAAFEAWTAKIRDIKKRSFLTPPLTDAGYIPLCLKLHDSTPRPSGLPTGQVTGETFLIGYRQCSRPREQRLPHLVHPGCA